MMDGENLWSSGRHIINYWVLVFNQNGGRASIMVNTIILAGFIGLISWILSGAKKNYFSVLEQIDSDLNLALKVLSDYSVDDFSARFTEINLKMQEFGTIKDVWNDYRKTLTRTIDIEGQHKLYSSISAS